MKKLLFLFVFASFCTFGQQKVYSFEKFETEIMSSRQLRETYPTLGLINLDDKKVQTKTFEIEQREISYDFYKFARDRNVKFQDFEFKQRFFLPIQVLVNEKGISEYLVYGFQKDFNRGRVQFDSLSSQELKIFSETVEAFCKEYTFPKSLDSKKYSIGLSVNFGRAPKKDRKNVISTIEMAQNCTQPDTVKSLMLNKLYLESFPEVVFRFKNLEKLDLSDNLIENIPNKLSSLKKLKFLSLSGNYINYVDFKFKRNKNLKDLNLQYTGMTKMPKSMKRNRRLEILFLGNNPIVFAKNDFRKLTGLKALNLYNVKTATLPKSIVRLQKLEELDLYYNELQFLPKEICQLKNLKTLAVANNQLWNLPEEISKMPNLQTLYAHHNRLNSLPNLPNLRLLDIGYNVFKVFPEQVYSLKNLEEFDITNNEIEEVPAKLLEMKNLQKVFIRGNEFFQINEKSKEITKLVADLEKKQILVR